MCSGCHGYQVSDGCEVRSPWWIGSRMTSSRVSAPHMPKPKPMPRSARTSFPSVCTLFDIIKHIHSCKLTRTHKHTRMRTCQSRLQRPAARGPHSSVYLLYAHTYTCTLNMTPLHARTDTVSLCMHTPLFSHNLIHSHSYITRDTIDKREKIAKTASDAFDVRIRHASNLHATKNKSWLTNTVFCLLLSLSLF